MPELDHNSPSVHNYLTILQDIISRMAGNSTGCKTWCIALVSAILLLIADRASPDLIWIAVAPILMFCILDAYYLALERSFRDRYKAFIAKLHSGTVAVTDLFIVTPPPDAARAAANTWRAIWSFSVWPFYTIQVLVLFAVRFLVFPITTPPA